MSVEVGVMRNSLWLPLAVSLSFSRTLSLRPFPTLWGNALALRSSGSEFGFRETRNLRANLRLGCVSPEPSFEPYADIQVWTL